MWEWQEVQEVLLKTMTESASNKCRQRYAARCAWLSGSHGPMAERIKLLLRRGRAYQTNEQSYDGERGIPRLCFMNAGKMAMDDESMTYVEGYITMMGSILIEHAWCVDAEGMVCDPTLRDGRDISDYFGLAFTTEFLTATVLRAGVWGLLGSRTRVSIDELERGLLTTTTNTNVNTNTTRRSRIRSRRV